MEFERTSKQSESQKKISKAVPATFKIRHTWYRQIDAGPGPRPSRKPPAARRHSLIFIKSEKARRLLHEIAKVLVF